LRTAGQGKISREAYRNEMGVTRAKAQSQGKQILRDGRSLLLCHAEQSEASALWFPNSFDQNRKSQKQILRRYSSE
jgi:hypothetical protein